MVRQAINVSHLSMNFQLGLNKSLPVLTDVSFFANYGEFISVLGISGSGKSTLLKCISSLLKPSHGTITIAGVNPYELKGAKLAQFRRRDISFIFQEYNLVPALPVLENVALPLRLSHQKVDPTMIKELLLQMNFHAPLNAFIGTLSGGEQQKIAIARAILSDSSIIFADEPTGALDSHSRGVVFELLKKLAEQGKCVFMVTHDLEMASNTDRALILKDGRIYKELIHPTMDQLYQTLESTKES